MEYGEMSLLYGEEYGGIEVRIAERNTAEWKFGIHTGVGRNESL